MLGIRTVPEHNFRPLRGTLRSLEVRSAGLERNLLGDPGTRQVAVYLPPGYESESRDYPLFIDLVGFTGSGLKHVGWQAFAETVPQRVERLIEAGLMGPVIVAFPDCFTSLGGNQYIDSLAMGRWEEFLIDDMVPALERSFRVRRGREHRALFGKSSGGYGALAHGLRRAEHWGAIASHSGDVDFDILYRRDFPLVTSVLARRGGDVRSFLEYLEKEPKISNEDFHALMLLAMAASYAPEADAPKGIRLPVTLDTCRLDAARWQRWLAHDPLELIETHEAQANFRSLRGIYIDCGTQDQYFIQYGTRAFVKRLTELGIPHTYEEFPDNHSGIDYRMDRSLPFLYRALG